MKRYFCLIILPALLLAPHSLSGADLPPRAELEALEEQGFKEAVALASASVVKIETVGGLDRIGQILAGTGPTTGVIVSEDGYVISSAFNFAAKPASILVTLPDGRRLPATQVATDKAKMLTLLKIEAKDLTPAVAAPAESYRVGQWAIALGRTYEDEQPNISIGIVSALGRIWGKAIQTDAKVSPVNYGGPLIDVEGRTLGILVPLSPQGTEEVAGVEWYDSGIGFAIPLAEIHASLDRLKSGEDLVPGLLGISLRGRDLFDGAPTIDRVRYGSPAQEAGLKVDDVIIELDGKPVVRQAQLKHVLGNKYAGDMLAIAVKRGEETIRAEVKLAAELVPYESAFLGILPARPDPEQPETAGVRVRYVYPESPAAKAGVKEEQTITKFNETEIADAAMLRDLVSRIRPGEKATLTFRGDDEQSQEIELGSLPQSVPESLRRILIPPQKAPAAGDEAPKTGRFTATLEAHEHDYWAYVPDDYNPAYQYALVVWIHPGGDTMEAAMIKQWKALCDERGIILLAPKAAKVSGWETTEQEFVHDLTQQFLETYSIDRSRVVLHSHASGANFAWHLMFKYRELFDGAAMSAAPLLVAPPDNEAELRQQFYLLVGEKDPRRPAIEATHRGLQNLKFPVILDQRDEGDTSYPPEEQVERIARWIDSLDRI